MIYLLCGIFGACVGLACGALVPPGADRRGFTLKMMVLCAAASMFAAAVVVRLS